MTIDRSALIGERKVGRGHPSFLIAEAGFNHNGSIKLALELVDAAAAAGADAIKFQSFTPPELLHKSVSYYHLFDGACLSEEEHATVARRCREKGILFASTPFSERWIHVLDALDADFIKIASMDLTSPTILEAAASTGRPIVLSTGLATMDEIGEALKILNEAGADEIVLLHCVSLYPTPIERINLGAIRAIEETFELPVGLSDHTLGVDVPAWAVAAGACCIEKHFTVDKTLKGADHEQSLDPREFKAMVQAIRRIEVALGPGRKEPCAEEQPLIAKTRRGIYLGADVHRGEIVDASKLLCVRPVAEGGIVASEFHEICGSRAARDLVAGDPLRRGDVE